MEVFLHCKQDMVFEAQMNSEHPDSGFWSSNEQRAPRFLLFSTTFSWNVCSIQVISVFPPIIIQFAYSFLQVFIFYTVSDSISVGTSINKNRFLLMG